MNKKGIQLGQAFGAVLTLVLVAILVIVSIYIFSALQTSFPLESKTITNESITMSTAGTALSNRTVCGYQSPAISQVVNTSGYILNSGNYTFNSTDSKLKNTTSIVNVKVTYTYDWRGEGCTASTNTITQFATYPALVGLVGTIIFLALVIGVLVASFAFGGNKGV